MDERPTVPGRAWPPRLSVERRHFSRIGSLRFFARNRALADELAGILGGEVPPMLQAAERIVAGSLESLILARISPTQALVLCGSDGQFTGIETRMAHRTDGCFVDQSCGISAFAVQGADGREFLSRLAATSAIPHVGEARTGRFAEVTVTALCVKADAWLLLVDRLYREHLHAWLRQSLADFR